MSEIISIDPLVILISMLNLVVLFLIFKRFLFDRVNAVLESRQKDIEASLSNAEEKHQDAIKVYNEYRRKIAASGDEARDIINKARLNRDKIIHTAELEAKQIKTRTGEELELEKQRAKRELQEEISEMVVLTTSKVLSNIKKETQEELLEEFLAM